MSDNDGAVLLRRLASAVAASEKASPSRHSPNVPFHSINAAAATRTRRVLIRRRIRRSGGSDAHDAHSLRPHPRYRGDAACKPPTFGASKSLHRVPL